MHINCPACQSQIVEQNLNIQDDEAYCPSCNQVLQLSSFSNIGAVNDFDVDLPPQGVSYSSDTGKVNISASTRSPLALFFVPFTVIWAGLSFNYVFGPQLLFAESGVVQFLLGVLIFFGMVVFGGLAAMMTAGRVQITISNNRAEIFEGIGSLGWTQNINWEDVRIIRAKKTTFYLYDSQIGGVCLEGKVKMKFGLTLTQERMNYIVNALRMQMQTF